MNILEVDYIPQRPSNEKAKDSYHSIRSELCSVINAIESATSNTRRSSNQNTTKATSAIVIQPFNHPIHHQVQAYKKQIKDLNRKLKAINACDNVRSEEEHIALKEAQLLKLERENKALKLIYSNHTKGLLQYRSDANPNEDLMSNIDKIIKLKEELQSQKDVYKGTISTIKAQMSQIQTMENKSSVIEENIAYRHKQDVQKKKDMMKGIIINSNSNNNINSNCQLIDSGDIGRNELQLSTDKSKYLRIIRNQKDKVNQITQEIELLTNQIHQFDKIKKLKEKELRKRIYLIQQFSHSRQIQSNSNETDKLKSRNNSQTARQKGYGCPKRLISKSRYQKISEVSKILYGIQSNKDNNDNNNCNKKLQHSNLFKEIELLRQEISSTIEKDLFDTKIFNKRAKKGKSIKIIEPNANESKKCTSKSFRKNTLPIGVPKQPVGHKPRVQTNLSASFHSVGFILKGASPKEP